MAKKPQQQPDPALQRSKRDVLLEARAARQAELEVLKRRHSAAVDAFADDLSDTAESNITRLAAELKAAASRMANIEVALERIEEQERAGRIEAARAASAADRETVRHQIGEPMLEAARAFDAAIATALDALRQFKSEADIASGALGRVVQLEHADDPLRRDDRLTILRPRVAGTSDTVAIALASAMRRLRDVLDPPTLQDHAGFNQFSPSQPATLLKAVELDAVIVKESLA
jgi:hypothetical protein